MPLTSDILKKYNRKVFCETGTHTGDGIECALTAGYEKIISIELEQYYFQGASNRFAFNHRVKILKGDSSICLLTALASVSEPFVLWLDAHPSGNLTSQNTPTLSEIEGLWRWLCLSKIPTVLLCDDMRLFDPESKSTIVKTIERLFPNSTIGFIDSPIAQKDILEVKIP
jgi:hypothetical protein